MRTPTGNKRVLVVSDHHETESLWIHYLGHRSLRATAADFRQISSLETYELVILDIHDCGENALAISRYTRATFAGPILLFTYEHDERFHLEAYRAGIDESVAKPIGNALAIAKVLAWLRRTSEAPAQGSSSIPCPFPYEVGMMHSPQGSTPAFRIDTVQRLLTTPEGRITKLSKLECRLLSFLIDNSGQTLSPDRMIDQVWAGNPSTNFSQLKNLVYRLRKKIEPDPARPRYLHTVPGFGYSFEVGHRK